MSSLPQGLMFAAGVLALAACNAPPQHSPTAAAPSVASGTAPKQVDAQSAPQLDVPDAPKAASAAVAIAPASSEAGQAVNAATFASDASATAAPADPAFAKSPAKTAPAPALSAATRRDLTIRAQVLLDRAHFSPGVIDGREGSNMRNAISAFETAHGLTADGTLDDAVWTQLTTSDARPALTDYVISDDDVKGPFLPVVPSNFKAMAKLERLSYGSPREMLAERFHMDAALLAALNPGVDFTQAGVRITVAATAADALAGQVARIEVDKGLRQVRAFDAAGKLLAVFPATVGSTERPAPDGTWAVSGITLDPNYRYDPSRLTFGNAKGGKLTIPPGPNNPVGSVWIALTKETYGIHGSPDPKLVGKTASHGCVRLTNWDARELAKATRKGAVVAFVGTEAPPARG